MSDKYFVDTNVLVYAFDQVDPNKKMIAQTLLKTLGSSYQLTISTQVLQEFFVTVTRKLKPVISIEEARELVAQFSCYPLVEVNADIIFLAIKKMQQENVSFWDALIISAALKSYCTVLLSEDMQDGQLIDNQLLIKNPFKYE